MKISLFLWLFLISLITICFSINAVLVSSQCQSDQQQLLLEFKNSFNSTMTGKLVKWDQSADCCSWDGVRCDAGGRVIDLDLSNQSIFGAIHNSNSLFRLQHLLRLNLAFNRFISPFPSGFDKFANMNFLNLSNAGFRGQIPAGISRMNRLVTLDLSVDFFREGTSKLEKPNLEMLVQNLTRLRFLCLDGVKISARGNEWCRALSSLTNLQVLSMSNCYLSGPICSSLSKLRSLSVISLDLNNLSASVPRFFAEFPNLTSLSLGSTGLSGILPQEVLRIPTLQTLDLSGNKLLEGSFENFPSNALLRTLLLEDTNFGGQVPESVGNLGQLETIVLKFCNFSGQIPESVMKLTKLVYLDFSGNNFSGPIPSFSKSRNITQLNLAHNQLNGTINSTDWSGLSKLVSIELQNNKFTGTIPPTLFSLPSLQKIVLSQNQFDGSLQDLSGKTLLVLDVLDLSSNKLQGKLPMSVFELQSLKVLSLSSNNFSGLIALSAIQKLKDLCHLDLSYNKLSIDATAANTSSLSFPHITTLNLASCNLMNFPDFLKNLSIFYLDLSSNNIHGEIPKWIWGASNLVQLNLSQNFLVEFEGPLQNISSNLISFDLHGNQLQGKIPFLPRDAIYLDYSNNNFSSVLPAQIGDYLSSAFFFSLSSNNVQGSIPSSICASSYLQVLDLSSNSLSGSIPKCLSRMSSSLGVLNLRRNNLSGVISDAFPRDCRLQTLDLNQNLLRGKVPKSLANCKMLEVLDIGNNQINDTFPCHLKNISTLRVLVLRANKFNGKIHCHEKKSPWPMLQIVDVASNSFSGRLQQTCLLTSEAMQADEEEALSKLKHLRFTVLHLNEFYFQDAITVTVKGLQLELVKILTVFTSIDISCNNFEGPIPEVIGTLKALYALNISHNAFTGSIPPSLGNLRQLESLDLSSNSLHGKIPSELANLNFLSFLNISQNKLAGKIPTSTQLQSFPEASFEDNAGLCGPPLRTMCKLPPATEDSPSDSESGSYIDWKFISAETGFFCGFGVVILPLIFWKRWRIWYYKRINRALFRLFPRLVLKIRKHERRGNWNQRRRL